MLKSEELKQAFAQAVKQRDRDRRVCHSAIQLVSQEIIKYSGVKIRYAQAGDLDLQQTRFSDAFAWVEAERPTLRGAVIVTVDIGLSVLEIGYDTDLAPSEHSVAVTVAQRTVHLQVGEDGKLKFPNDTERERFCEHVHEHMLKIAAEPLHYLPPNKPRQLGFHVALAPEPPTNP